MSLPHAAPVRRAWDHIQPLGFWHCRARYGGPSREAGATTRHHIARSVTHITSGLRLEFLLLTHGSMPIREFTDSTGASWVVWSTLPSLGGLPVEMRGGWLTFDSPQSRRRLMPIPPSWEEAPAARLELLCRAAVEVRRTLSVGFGAVDSEPSDP